jgi:hypothetical protein
MLGIEESAIAGFIPKYILDVLTFRCGEVWLPTKKNLLGDHVMCYTDRPALGIEESAIAGCIPNIYIYTMF